MATKTLSTGNTDWTITYTVTETTTTYKINVTKVVAKYTAGTWSQKYYADVYISFESGDDYEVFSGGVLPKGDKTKSWTRNNTCTMSKETSADRWAFNIETWKTNGTLLYSKYSAWTTVPALPKYTLSINWMTVTNGVAKYQNGTYSLYHGVGLTFNARPAYNDDGLALTGYLKPNANNTGSPSYYTRSNFTITLTSNLTLYEIAQHTISYNGNGSTSGSTAANTVYFPSAHTVASNGFAKTGYTFSHWNSKADNKGSTYKPGASLSTNNFDVFPTLFAIWKRTITYNANVPSGTTVTNMPEAQSSVINTALTLSAKKPERSGYTFLGWSKTSNGGVAYQPGATYPVNQPNQTLYALWGPTVSITSVTRTDSSGTADILGGSVNVVFTSNGQTSYSVSMGSLSSTTTSSASGSKSVLLNGDLTSVNPETAYTVTVTATNGAGSVSATVNVPKTDYKRPAISSLLSTRVDASRQNDDEGTYARLTVNWAIHPTNSQKNPTGFAIEVIGADETSIPITQPTVTGVASPTTGSVFYIPLVSGGYVYSLTQDTEVNLSKDYYSYDSSTDAYIEVTLQYYTYTLTSDVTVDTSKTYYSYDSGSGAYTAIGLSQYSYTPTSDTSIVSGKTYYVLIDDQYLAVSSPVEEDLILYLERSTNSPSGYYERSATNPSNVYYERAQIPGPFDVNTSYTFTVTLTDKMGSSYKATRSDILSNAYFTMDVLGDAFRYQPATGSYDSNKRYYVEAYTYEQTKDTAIDSGKTYYSRSGSGTEQSPYVYTQVVSPSSTWVNTYYERFDNGYSLVENSSSSDFDLYFEASGPAPGHGVGFGMPSLKEGFDVRMPATFYNESSIKDNVVTATRTNLGYVSGFRAKNEEKGASVCLLVDESGANHGVWSDTLNKWLIYANLDTSTTFLHGGDAYIKFVANDTDGNGDMIVIGGGGPVVIGSGESADNARTAIGLTATSNEAMYITSDSSIQFLTNCNTIANRKNAYISTEGTIVARQGMNRISNNVADARTVVSSSTLITSLYDYDGGSRRVGYSEIIRTNTGVYRSFTVTNPKSSVTTGIYIYADDAAGSFNGRRYSFSDPAAFRSACGFVLRLSAKDKTVTDSSARSAGANYTIIVTLDATSGYMPFSVCAAKANNGNVVIRGFDLDGLTTGGTPSVYIYCHANAAISANTATYTAQILGIQTTLT